MAEKKKPPFSTYEKELLKELATPYLGVIECKKTDAVYGKKKHEAWIQITEKFNNSPQCCKATVQQLKKLWLNMKARARDCMTVARQRKHTGGGPYVPDLPPEDDLLGGILNNIMPSIEVPMDSDGVADAGADNDNHSYSRGYTQELVHPPPPPDNNDGAPESDVNITEYIVEQSITDAPEKSLNKVPKKSSKNLNVVDALKTELIKKDIEQRENTYLQNQLDSKKTQTVKLELIQLELEHKRKYYSMIEEEMLMELEHKQRMHKMIEEEQEIQLKKAKKIYGTQTHPRPSYQNNYVIDSDPETDHKTDEDNE